MHQLKAILRTSYLRQFNSPVAWLFFLILPLIFTAAVGAGLKGMMNDSDGPDAPQELRITLHVIQTDQSDLVDALFDTLRNVNFEIEPVNIIPENTFGLEIPADFSTRLLAGKNVTLTLHTLPDNTSSPAVEQAVMAAQGRVGGAALVAQMGLEQARSRGSVSTPEEERTFFAGLLTDTLTATKTPTAIAEVRWPEGVTLDTDVTVMANSAEHASAGQIVTWVQITLLGAAEILVDERLRGTLKRMLITPTSRTLIFGSMLSYTLLTGLAQIALLLLGGALLFGVGWGQAPLAVIAVSLTFAFAVVGLGLLLATMVKTRGQASSIVVGLSMTMSALGGAWFPLEVTPPLFRQVVQIFPSNWAMSAYTDILARSATLTDVLPNIVILLAFGAAFTALGMWRFSRYEG